MNNLTTSPVAQYFDMSMQVQVCKGKASSLVKVDTLTIPQSQRRTEHDRFLCLNHRDKLNRSTLDLNLILVENDESQCFNNRDKLNSTVQISCGMRTCIACMNT